MAKKTLLEIVQEILSDMDSDPVNSIDDTDEATQVAQIVKSTYDAMLSNRNWAHTKRIIKLQASTDSLLPTHMTLSEDIKEMISIYYNKIKNDETRIRYEPVKWLEPDDFLRYTNKRNSDDADVMTVIDTSGVELLIQTDKAPSYYTSFDDTTIVFDSYDSEVDSTLQTSKTQARAYIIPAFLMEDDTIPDLPIDAFSALIEEAKSKAMFKLKQMQDVKAEQEAGRQGRWLSRKNWTVNCGIRFPDYGRKGRRGRNYVGKDPTFNKDNN
jgi:hypothetical protein